MSAIERSVAPQVPTQPRITLWPASGPRRLSAHVVTPSAPDHSLAPLVAVHGIRRGAKVFARGLAAEAERTGRVVIAPLFSEADWPAYQRVVRKGRADLALLALIGELRGAGIIRAKRVRLTGFSGGAQFVHRFAMLYPEQIEKLITSSAGWYTFPDQERFPYGLKDREGRRNQWGSYMAARLKDFLALPIEVCVGSADNRPDGNTRSNDIVDPQQGEDRTMRAVRWSIALEKAALARGIAPRIGLHILDGCAHSLKRCLRDGGLDRIAMA